MKKRKVTRIVRGRKTVDGAGVHLRRILGEQTVVDFDPFLMLDGFDSTNPQDYIKGFPWHPHRGIETITYLVSGTMEHEDSLGNKGVIQSMGCQWMTGRIQEYSTRRCRSHQKGCSDANCGSIYLLQKKWFHRHIGTLLRMTSRW